MTEDAKDFGVLLPTRGVLVYADGKPPKVELNFQMAETAEMLGYDSVWVGDSITSKPRLEALTMMGAVGARTKRVKLGSATFMKMRTGCLPHRLRAASLSTTTPPRKNSASRPRHGIRAAPSN